ncbi:MAG: T9SS type A sorting domain-containing protein [Ignavibacteriaceae bacterium]
MKKFIIFLVFLFLSTTLFAQTYFDVPPGNGTLNEAITAHQGNVIYRLQAGQWYGLSGIIENNGFPLTIIGITPDKGQMPAEIQTGTNSDGTVFQAMFNILNDLTLRNVFIVNANSFNSIGPDLMTCASTTPVKIVLDSVTCDPVGNALGSGFATISFGNTPHPKLFITNSLFLRCGTLDGANDGDVFSTGGSTDNGFDTLYVENNTFMSTGTWFWRAGLANRDSENVVWINHNSFIFHKSQLAWSWQANKYFVTNNLFFDFTTQPWNFQWNVYFPDGDTTGSESWMALVNQDTASYDSVTTLVGDSVGMRFTSDSSFNEIMVNGPTWQTPPPNSVTFKLYKWNKDYETTVAGAPLSDTTFANFGDNFYLYSHFNSQPEGEYYWQLSNATGIVGIWKYNNTKDSVTSYFDGQVDTSGNYISQLVYTNTGTSINLANSYGTGTTPVRITPFGKVGGINSTRQLFVEYNSFYTDPRIQAYTTSWAATHTVNNDGVTPLSKAYIMHLMYPQDSAGVNREAQMSSDKTHFPYFFEGNYYDNLIGTNPPNTDPQWTDQRLYATQDSLVNWTLPAAELNTWGFSANNVNPQPNQAGNWFWNADTVYNYGNPEVWPRVNCSYKNSTMLTASIEGLPLGDLNWFPAQKAIWQKNKASIMAHILSEDTSTINITSVKLENNQTPTNFTLSQNYPNPFNPSTEIKYSIPQSGLVTLKVYNLLGQEVATLVNQEQRSGNYLVNFDALKLASGVYMYRMQSGNFSLTKKMVLVK